MEKEKNNYKYVTNERNSWIVHKESCIIKIHILLCKKTKLIKFNNNYQEKSCEKTKKTKINFKIIELNFKGKSTNALKIRKE